MLDAHQIEYILDGFWKRLNVFPDLHEHKNLIQKAVDFAIEAHQGQVRRYSKRPFIHHPLKVGVRAYEQFQDLTMLLAGILHDTIEDGPNVKRSDLYDIFGQEVAFIVDAVSDNILDFHNHPELKFGDKIEKLLYGGLQDIRCLILKILDRNHNLIGISDRQSDKQIRKCFEVQAIYRPLKYAIMYSEKSDSIPEHKIALQKYLEQEHITTALEFKNKLYNFAFENLDPDTFEVIRENANNITRQIKDEQMFKKLAEKKGIDDYITITSMRYDDNGKFIAHFQIKKGMVFDHIDEKLDFSIFSI